MLKILVAAKGARIVILTSDGHVLSGVRFDDYIISMMAKRMIGGQLMASKYFVFSFACSETGVEKEF